MKNTLIFMATAVLVLSCQKTLSDAEVKEFRDKGAKISQDTYQKLSGALMKSMKEGGIPEAIKFCNKAALPLTQEMSDVYKVHIKRTALKTRNENNSPNKEEVFILNYYKELAEKGQKPEPIAQLDENNDPHYYAPIILQKQCMSCHGTLDKEVSRTTDSIIKTYYPNDRALGFQENDLRGIWSITFLANN